MLVVAVLGILATAIVVFLNPAGQIKKANDSKRKSDLSQIKNALETYYNDFGQYPAADTGSQNYRIKADAVTTLDWGTTQWQYIGTLPKDPSASRNYIYYSPSGGQSYYLYASLERGSADAQACNGGSACANVPGGASCGGGTCNYGISSSNVSP